MLLLVPLQAPPLFRITHVAFSKESTLSPHLEIADARRDGSAVGTTGGRLVNTTYGSTVYVLGGRWIEPRQLRLADGGGPPMWKPVAILGRRRVVVRRFEGLGDYRSATVGASLIVGKPMKTPPKPATQVPATVANPEGLPPAPPAWIPTRAKDRGRLGIRGLSWRSTKAGDFGDAELWRLSLQAHDYDPVRVALLRRGGAARPLGEYVAGRPDLGGVAWVSPAGWNVVRLWRKGREGLAWIEHVKR